MKETMKTKSLFLPAQIPGEDGTAEIYSLDEEFARTRRNRNITAWLAVTGFVFFLVAGTMSLTTYIEKKNMKTDFTIAEYQDLNLKELLDTSKKYQRQLDRAKKAMAELRMKAQAELESAATAGSRRAISNKYAQLISAQENQITEIQKKRDQYDLTMRENIRKAEAIVNNSRRLHQLELRKERDRLTRRYNPWFTSSRLKRILKERVKKPGAGADSFRPWSPAISGENVMARREFDELHRRVSNQFLLIGRMKKIPYRNSVRPALRGIDSLSRSAVYDYERLWHGLAERIIEKNRVLDSYSYAFDKLIQDRPESGYIIDARDRNSIRVYMSRIHSTDEGVTGFVFRSDDVYIGRIGFYNRGGSVRARVIELVNGKNIEPFDRILLKNE